MNFICEKLNVKSFQPCERFDQGVMGVGRRRGVIDATQVDFGVKQLILNSHREPQTVETPNRVAQFNCLDNKLVNSPKL